MFFKDAWSQSGSMNDLTQGGQITKIKHKARVHWAVSLGIAKGHLKKKGDVM